MRPKATHRSRLLLCLGLLAGVLTPASAGAAPAPARLAGTTTITARTSASSDVLLPAPAAVRIKPGIVSPDVTVTGAGRFAGLTLTRIEDGEPVLPTLFSARMNKCFAAGCTPTSASPASTLTWVTGVAGSPPGSSVQDFTLPAGRYRLNVFTDGSPVTVRLTLRGLGGTTRLAPTRSLRPTAVTVPPDVDEPGVYSAGAAARLDAPLGLLLHVHAYDVSPHAYNTSGVCFYLNSRPPRNLNVRGCPGGDGGGVVVEFTSVWTRVTGVQYGFAVVSRMTGELYQGFYQDGVYGSGTHKLALFWLPLG